MPITIQAHLAKKVPLPGTTYASHQAAITLTAEIADLSQVGPEAQRLYALAEQAINAQLQVQPQPGATTPTPLPSESIARTLPPAGSPPPLPLPPRAAGASRPYARVGRGPAPITESQLRFIGRLLQEGRGDPAAILPHYQVGSLQDLTCKDAAQLIDELKSRAGASA